MAFTNNDDINAIRNKADIVSIIGSYIPLSQRGKNYVCVCPFHDDHSPSMSVSPEKQIYKCFACGKTGNVFTFVSDYEDVPFLDAVAIVASKCGMEFKRNITKQASTLFKTEYEIMNLAQKFFQNNLRTEAGKEAMAYLQERGLDEKVIKEFGIGLSLDSNDSLLTLLTKKGYDEKTLVEIGLVNNVGGKFYDMFSRRITFPLWDKDGNIVGFSARVYRGEKDVSKYMNSKESKIFKKGETLYNYHKAKDVAKRDKKIILVEGFMDAIRISSSGIKNVVALQGTAMTKDQIELLKKLRVEVVLCLDNDNAGLIASLNNGEELEKNNVPLGVIRLSGEKDPDEYIVANGKDAFIDNLNHELTFFEFKMNYLKQNKDLNKIEDQSEYIKEVLSNLALKDDVILREVTLNSLSKEYNVDVSVLKSQLESIKPKTTKVVKETPVLEPTKKDSYMKTVEKVLYFMMNGVEYVEAYQKKVGFFADEIYREIANEIVYYVEAEKSITVADFITYVSDKDSIRDKVMEIVNESVNDEVNMEVMDDYIQAILKVMTKNEIKRLKLLMKNELDVDKKMKLAMQIAELKKEDV
jgi:DNA primase